MGVTHSSDYQQWKLDPLLQAGKKIGKHGFEKKEAPRKFKDEWSAWQVTLTAFWDCSSLVYMLNLVLMPIKENKMYPKTLILLH